MSGTMRGYGAKIFKIAHISWLDHKQYSVGYDDAEPVSFISLSWNV